MAGVSVFTAPLPIWGFLGLRWSADLIWGGRGFLMNLYAEKQKAAGIPRLHFLRPSLELGPGGFVCFCLLDIIFWAVLSNSQQL